LSLRAEPLGEPIGFLDGGSRIEGELRFKETFRVEGSLVGKVSSQGDLIVGKESTVEGDIRVRRLFVSGVVRGSVQADVETPALLIEEGAHFQGRCVMDGVGSVSDERKRHRAILGKERFIGWNDSQWVTSEK